MSLPSSGAISVGMLNYEITTGGSVDENDVATSNAVCDNDFLDLSYTFSALADNIGATSRANLLAAPYGLNEFYGYQWSECVIIGTEILMADGSIKLVEDLLIDDEVCSVIIPDMTQENYRNFSIENLDEFIKDTGLVKRLTFDFIDKHININEKYHVTQKHPAFVWKDKIKRFEWWQAENIEIGDKMVTSNFELEEVTTIQKMHGDFEIVILGLKNIHTYFANGYLCHQ
jgi:hypothetical protein